MTVIPGDLASLRAVLRADLTEAMRSGDRTRTSAIRTLTAAFANAEAVPSAAGSEPVPFGTAEVPRNALDAGRATTLLEREIADRAAALADYDRHPDAGHAAGLRAEIDVLQAYLDAFVTGR